MSDELSRAAGPFDVAAVSALVTLMKEFDINEIDLQDGEQRIRLRRGARVVATSSALPMHAPMMPAAPSSGSALPPTVHTPTAPGRALLEIKSELVGTFFAKPAPDKDDYVKVGARVSPDSVVCTVEAMKIFNNITAKCTGTIAEVCVQNGEFVEFEQVLFRVDPS